MAKNKESRAEKHEYCPGYMDEYGIWNNGFYCPRWGGADDLYCCGSDSRPHCCPPPAAGVASTTPKDNPGDADLDIAQYIPIIIGVSVALFVAIAAILIGCFVCRCCPGYKRRKPPSPVSQAQSSDSCSSCHNHTVSTSACTSSHTTDSNTLHCGCRWSPTNSRNTVDIDQMLLTLYENPTAAWQQELEQHLSDFPIEDPPPYTENHTSIHVTDVDLLKNLDSKSESSDTTVDPERDAALLSLLSQTSIEPKLSAHGSVANSSLGRDRQSEEPGVLCMTSFRPLNSPRNLDVDKYKRDSGVLVEENSEDIYQVRPYTVNTSAEQTIVVRPGHSRRTSRSSLDYLSLHSPTSSHDNTEAKGVIS